MRIDPSAIDFIARLNDFYYQFARVGNNYNQIVRQVNTHFSDRTIPGQLYELEKQTRELKALSVRIIKLAEEFRAKWFPG